MARARSKSEEFIVSWSQPKIWVYAALCWALALLFFLPIGLVLAEVLSSGGSKIMERLLLICIFGPIFLLFAWLPLIFLKRRHAPLAVLNKSGYTGLGNWLKSKHQNWQPDTKLIFMKGIILVNPDPLQSKASELFWGSKKGVRISHILAKQNRYEIEAAIERLNPFR